MLNGYNLLIQLTVFDVMCVDNLCAIIMTRLQGFQEMPSHPRFAIASRDSGAVSGQAGCADCASEIQLCRNISGPSVQDF